MRARNSSSPIGATLSLNFLDKAAAEQTAKLARIDPDVEVIGFSQRFGLVHVDFDTQVRTIKESGKFYREVIRTNGGALA